MELIDKHKFVKVSLDQGLEIFVICLGASKTSVSIMIVYSIRKLLLAALDQNKALVKVLIK